MSEKNISLFDLLNVAIGTPQEGVVNFSALHALLHAVLRQLDTREVMTRWTDTPPGDAPVGVTAPEQNHHTEEEQHRAQRGEIQPGTELRERVASPSSPTPSSGRSADGQLSLRSRIQTCEDGLNKAMKLIQELHSQKDNLKEELKETLNESLREEMKELCHEQKALKLIQELHSQKDNLKEELREELKETLNESLREEMKELCHEQKAMKLIQELHNQKDNLKEELRETLREEMKEFCHEQKQPRKGSGSETMEAQRNIVKLKESFSELEACVAALQEGKEELTELRELIADKASQNALSNLMDQLNQQRALTDSLMRDREKLDSLEEHFMNLTSQDRETSSEAASGSEESDSRASRELRQQMSYLRKSVQKLQDDTKQLKAKQALSVERATGRHLQDQNVNDVQKAILQLQAECEKLHETNRSLHEDNRQKQSHIEKLYKTTEELEEKKANKSEIKTDKSALESKVSRLQFDSATEQLNAMFHELLNKLTDQEQDWHKVIDRLSAEMECKLNRMELDSVKKQLEDRLRNIHEKLRAQGAPEHEDAAGIRKQLVDRFHCLSCDRHLVMHSPGNHLQLPSTPGFPSHKSIRPFTVNALEQFRQHYRRERISEYSHVPRSSGGSHTVTSAYQRRSGLQYVKHHAQTDVDSGVIQSEEVDIIGLDGQIYKGRLNVPGISNTETKLPTISTKDGKTKDKAKSSLTLKPAASPEAHQPHSATSAQCSHSASSSSGRDWPVSALAVTPQSSVTPASAAAESNTEPPADDMLHL